MDALETTEGREYARSIDPKIVDLRDDLEALWEEIAVLQSTLDTAFASPVVEPSHVLDLMVRLGELNATHASKLKRFRMAVADFRSKQKKRQVAPTGARRDTLTIVLAWLKSYASQNEFKSVEELARLCKEQTGCGSAGSISPMLNNHEDLLEWRHKKKRVSVSVSAKTSATIDIVVEPSIEVEDEELVQAFISLPEYQGMPEEQREVARNWFRNLSTSEKDDLITERQVKMAKKASRRNS